ncbi:hypothetical protein Psal006b_03093 [Piscirickettsia salmonis]|uniref:Uncharacterized protein n=2 Tax=Piscirickettsia salmonis TaxID=1238 RepID=A0A1L6TG17_PISSA|nr:hypothetical protein KU39_136 [Piscirickettsia salmonis]ALT18068.1 hypothetical protein PSLF89_03590 [Piscirickettsia salmonis LF-89 = ATCC VR-1361]ALY01561.1 hypothetical protein AWE47_00655 [Piscirickettsia salmonis]AMA41074.1 hypothetical protein AWJ11_00665 [Piscirickettsia salmonis]AOS36264.1 hypothetical protein AVM72_13655 [Piscirickettsia salmonis]
MAGGYLKTFQSGRTGSEPMHESTERGVNQCMELVNECMVSGNQKNQFGPSSSSIFLSHHLQGEVGSTGFENDTGFESGHG